MQHILYIKSSVLGASSQTSALVDALQAHWTAQYPEARHAVRDLTAAPLPHLSPAHLGAAPVEGVAALRELQSVDTVVIAAPMYNFGIPSTLKAWVDHVAKAGETFQYTSTGPEGLLKNKRAVLIVSTGGVYSEGPYQAADFVVPYLKTVLGFLGIVDVTVIRAEGIAMGETGQASVAAALAQVCAL